ncbi:hypothetical protein GCM10023238_17690 [Streptomyces heliomycini]
MLKSAMGTLQSLAEEQQLLLDGLLQKYGNDTEVLADLMSVDHTGSQFSRRAKGISVLCGGWLGRREGVATVYDVARSAQGRIKDFNRVSIHAQASVAVTSKAVEPVAMVLAELLDNATTYSAPGTPVEVKHPGRADGCVLHRRRRRSGHGPGDQGPGGGAAVRRRSRRHHRSR